MPIVIFKVYGPPEIEIEFSGANDAEISEEISKWMKECNPSPKDAARAVETIEALNKLQSMRDPPSGSRAETDNG